MRSSSPAARAASAQRSCCDVCVRATTWRSPTCASETRAAGRGRQCAGQAAGAACLPYQLDVRDAAGSRRRSASRCCDDFDGLDVVVPNAGVNTDNLLVSMSDEEWRDVHRHEPDGRVLRLPPVPADAARDALRPVRPHLVGRAQTACSGQANYCASKAGLHGLRGAREGVRPQGHHQQRGGPRLLRHRHDARRHVGGEPRVLANTVRAGRMGELSEVSRAVLFLASGGAGFINGQAIAAHRRPRLGAVTRPASASSGSASTRQPGARHGQTCARRAATIGRDPRRMMVDERSLNPVWEDPVTMAVNAANRMLTDDDRESIELLIVATESGVDQEKPISTWVQRYLGLDANCRNFEIKHACYGGTGRLQMAVVMDRVGPGRRRQGAGDLHRPEPHASGQAARIRDGRGARRPCWSRAPPLARDRAWQERLLDNEVSDLTRPTLTVETGDTETSLLDVSRRARGRLRPLRAARAASRPTSTRTSPSTSITRPSAA